MVPYEVTVANKSHGGTPNKILPAIRTSQRMEAVGDKSPKSSTKQGKRRGTAASKSSAPGTGKSLKRVDSRVANAMAARRKPGCDKADFFSLRKNDHVEYAKSEYYINVYFQRFLSEKIRKHKLAGLDSKKNDSHLPAISSGPSQLNVHE